jgi:predicted outer membrane repeat protein
VLLVPSALLSQNPIKEVFGNIQGQPGRDSIRVFLKDTLYRISGDLKIQNNGVLLIEPGTTVEFLPNGRLINEVGGSIIADGRIDAEYNANPGNLNPLINRATYPDGYGDVEYFSYTVDVNAVNRGTVEAVEAGNKVAIANTRSIESEPTISAGNDAALLRFNYPPLAKHANEPDAATRARKLAAYQGWQPGKVIMYVASRIRNVDADQNIVNNPWTRSGGSSINVTPDTIIFRGNSVNSFSREWGHIVVLPGARMSYFRQCNFENFLKDTTVDRLPYYTAPNGATQAVRQSYEDMNDRLVSMTNGSGAALTSFSVRTWLVGCNFRDNEARYHGGALQLLQSPLDNFGDKGQQGVYPNYDITQVPFYTQASNPNMLNITEPNGVVVQQQVRGIDRLGDVAVALGSLDHPEMDSMRQSHDDARVALFLGRVRGLTFSNNIVRVRDVDVTSNGVVRRNDAEADVDTVSWKNEAFGGAMYIGGRTPIEVTLGNNNFYDGFGNLFPTVGRDYVKFANNRAINLQAATPRTVNGRTFFTNGAKGGALYVGSATSVIISGHFQSNWTNTEFNSSSENFSQGGAIYASSNSPRIQVRGGLEVGSTAPGGAAPSHFINNRSGRGGAIFAHLITPTNAPNLRPLVIGGSNAVGNTADFRAARDYGVNIRFDNNSAESDGGAIYSNKALRIIGGGGTVGVNIAYSDNDRVWFRDNRAGFSGGAVSANIFGQLDVNDRAVVLTRTKFETNRVGLDTATAGNELSDNDRLRVKGGGALYVFDGNLATVLASEFSRNEHTTVTVVRLL